MFGGKPAFGGTTGFGGTTSTGLFGTSNNSNSLFGQPATPNTGGGLFSNNRPTGSIFGATPATSGSLFNTPGAPTATTGTSLFGGGTSAVNPINITGTGTIKFQPTAGADSVRRNGINCAVTTKLHCITAMKEYSNKSVDELRVEDYKADRKRPTQAVQPAGGLFGASTNTFGTGTSGGFGAASTSTAGTLFGSPAPATSTAGGLFGGGSAFGTTKPMFGAATTTTVSSSGLFGTPQPAQSNTGLFGFGTNTTNTTASTGGGLFGNVNKPATVAPFGSGIGTTNVFGQPNTGGGLFGGASTSTAQPVKSIFGSTTPAAPSGGLFGATQPSTSGGLFGNTAPPTSSAGGGFSFNSGFGTTTNTSGTGLFGTTNTSTAGGGLFGASNTGTGLFGQTTSTAPKFGQTTGQTGGLFGTSTSVGATNLFNTAPTSVAPSGTVGGGGLFGNTTGGGGLFGSTNVQNPIGGISTGTTGGFGGFGTTTAPPTTGFQFAGTSGTGLFGGSGGTFNAPNTQAPVPNQVGLSANPWEALAQQAQLQQQILSLVANSPYGRHSLFRDFGATSSSSGIEDSNKETSDSSSLGASIAKGSNLFSAGNISTRNQLLSKSLRPAMLTAKSKQPRLLPPARKQLFSGYDEEEHESFRHRSDKSSTTFSNANQRMQFTSVKENSQNHNATTASPFFVSRGDWKRLHVSQLRRTSIRDKKSIPPTDEEILSDDHNRIGISSANQPRSSSNQSFPSTSHSTYVQRERDEIKREVQESSKIGILPATPNHVRNPLGASSPINIDISQSKPTANQQPASVESSTTAETSTLPGGNNNSSIRLPPDVTFSIPTPFHEVNSADRGTAMTSGVAAQSSSNACVQQAPADSTCLTPYGLRLTRPDYYIVPSLEDLVEREAKEILSNKNALRECWIDDFIIGRKGFGHILFPGRTNIAGLNLDEIVHFANLEVNVYPEEEGNEIVKKPPVGQGLNKLARVTLEKVWPTHRATRQPINDPQKLASMHFVDKLERATTRLEATFLSYEPSQGLWKFEVQHFSKYRFLEDDEEDDADQESDKCSDLKKTTVPPPTNIAVAPPKNVVANVPASSSTSFNQIFNKKFSVDLDADDSETEIGSSLVQDNFKRRTYCLNPNDLEVDSNSSNCSVVQHNLVSSCDMLGFVPLKAPEMHSNDTLLDKYHISQSSLQRQKVSLFFEEDEDSTGGVFALPAKQISKSFAPKQSSSSSSQLDCKNLDTPATAHRKRQPPHLISSAKKKMTTTDYEQIDSSFFKSIRKRLLTPLPSSESVVVNIGGSAPCAPVYATLPEFQLHLDSVPAISPAALLLNCCQALENDVPQMSTFKSKLKVLLDSASQTATSSLLASRDLSLFHLQRQPVSWSCRITSTFESTTHKTPSLALLLSSHSTKNIRTPLLTKMEFNQQQLNLFSMNSSQCMQNNSALCITALETFHPANEDLLNSSLESSCCTFKATNPNIPRWMPTEGAFGLESYRQLSTLSDDSRRLLDLCHALWGSDDNNTHYVDVSQDTVISMKSLVRCQMLSQWLRDQLTKENNFPTNNSKGCEEIFYLLTSGKMETACHVALTRCNRPRLASLLSQFVNVTASPIVKQLVRSQLAYWYEYEIDVLLDKWELYIYIVLAAYPQWEMSNGKICQPLKELSWLRCFAVFYWFMQSDLTRSDNAISSAFECYTSAFEEGIVTWPKPIQLSTNNRLLSSDETCFDYAYHLLYLFCDRTYSIERILEPSSQSLKLEHYFGLAWENSWHLWRILMAIGYSHLTEFHSEQIHLNFSHELEQSGKIHWAIFVLLHLSSPEARRYHVSKLLSRHVILTAPSDVTEAMEINDDVTAAHEYQFWEKFIVDRLFVPARWIHDSKALRAHYEKLPLLEVHHLLVGKNFIQAQKVAVNEVQYLIIHRRFSDAFVLCQRVLVHHAEVNDNNLQNEEDRFSSVNILVRERVQLFLDFVLLRQHVVRVLKCMKLLDNGIISSLAWRELTRGLMAFENEEENAFDEEIVLSQIYSKINDVKIMVRDIVDRLQLLPTNLSVERECRNIISSYCLGIEEALDKCDPSSITSFI